MKRSVPVESASALIDEKIKELGDWRGKPIGVRSSQAEIFLTSSNPLGFLKR